jgi:hypothetical protein
MRMKPLRTRPRTGIGWRALGALALTSAVAMPWSDSRAGSPTYSINFHAISSGGNRMQNGCFRLSETVGQTAPGYSSVSTYSLIAGFWPAAAPTLSTDEIFFNGFEGC